MTHRTTRRLARLSAITAPLLPALAAGQSFVNWESPHVSPIAATPDGARILVVNTPDNRLEVFDAQGGVKHLASVPVGLDPVSVQARTNDEVWVINHISDSISIVDLATMRVRDTINTGDEPTDIRFAGTSGKAFVSMSQLNEIWVYDPASLTTPPNVIPIEGEDPRALVTDGNVVLAAVFESGNNTTILGEEEVSSSGNPYPGNQNPPPNSGTAFDPPIAAGLPTPPEVGIILKKMNGQWMDDNNGNWSGMVAWDMHDHDVAIIDADNESVTGYATGLMNANMALGLRNGTATVVGTDGTNHIRFEPNLVSTFLRVNLAMFDVNDPNNASTKVVMDLNPHLDYSTSLVPQTTRDLAIGDPRAIVWNDAGTRGYIAGMGSNNVIVIDGAGARVGLAETAEGPTGLLLDEAAGLLYVMAKFEAALSIIDTATLNEVARLPIHDPSPVEIKIGRPHLYDTHATSGLGHVSCASCHIDGRMDQLAWDLGAPDGEVKDFNQVCNFGLIPLCEDWHPMKGPMTTQTLVGLAGTAPFHWRADREDLAAFNPAFVSLLGDDTELTAQDMTEFDDFVATMTYPPNPYRNMDNSLPTTPINGGDAVLGESLFQNVPIDGGALTCVQCHAQPTGTNQQLTSANALQESQSMKVPQLRNMHEKTGFDRNSANNNRGFGFLHDGSDDTLVTFLEAAVFNFPSGNAGDQQRRDISAFLFAFATDTHAGVGTQTTVLDGTSVPASQNTLINDMIALSQAQAVGLVVKGLVNGEPRGYVHRFDGFFHADRNGEALTPAALLALATPGGELTYTLVPRGSETRIGIDRDLDGWRDGDELSVCTDSGDPAVFPGSPLSVDQDANLVVNVVDLLNYLDAWFQGNADFNQNGTTDVVDLLDYLDIWFDCM